MDALEEIAARKQRLLERSEAQRGEMARSYYQWEARTHVAKRTFRILRHPLFLAGLGLVALKLPWRRAFKMGGWALKAWRLLRLVQRMVI